MVNTSLAAAVAKDYMDENHPRRSFDHSVSRPAFMEDDVLTGYGLAKKWGNDAEDPAAPEQAKSEHAYYGDKVKRNNLVQLFLDEYEVDKFVATHLFGDVNASLNMGDIGEDVFDALNMSLNNSMQYDMQFSTSFIKYRKVQKYQISQVTKLTPFETYIALIKGYCAILILFIPSYSLRGFRLSA